MERELMDNDLVYFGALDKSDMPKQYNTDCKCIDWDEDDYGDCLYERWKDKRDD